MATTTFSGPIVSTNGFTGAVTGAVTLPVTVTASLPASAETGTLYVITDNGAANDETAVVVYDGSAWVVCSGAALS
jgi:hypothetical protein